MTTSFKGSVEIFINNCQSRFHINKAGRNRDAITIVMLTSKMGYFWIPAESTTYMGILVYSHLNTVSRTTNDNTTFVFTLL